MILSKLGLPNTPNLALRRYCRCGLTSAVTIPSPVVASFLMIACDGEEYLPSLIRSVSPQMMQDRRLHCRLPDQESSPSLYICSIIRMERYNNIVDTTRKSQSSKRKKKKDTVYGAARCFVEVHTILAYSVETIITTVSSHVQQVLR